MNSVGGSARDDRQATVNVASVWRRAHVTFGLSLLLWAVLYWPSLQTMVRAWRDTGTYQYAFLIVPIVVWMVWTRRRVTATQPLSPAGWAVLVVAGASLLWMLGALVSVNVVEHFAIVAMLPCLVLACYGRYVAKSLMFPLGYLFFAVPWGNFLVGPLRTVTARISVRLLQLSGATVFLNGHLIEVPVGSFEVADACSGIKFFIATTALGTLYAYLFYRSWRRRLLFVLAALIVPIIANGLRVYFTILIGQTFGMQYATGTDHMIFGWQFFGSVLILLFLAGWYWREEPLPSRSAKLTEMKGLPYPRIKFVAAITFVALTIGPIIAFAITPGSVPVAAGHQWNIKRLGPGKVTAVSPGDDPLGDGFGNADDYLHALYHQGGVPIWVYIAQYRGLPQHGHEVLDYPNLIYPKHWSLSSERDLLSDKRPVRQLYLQHNFRHWLVWYWYQVDGRAATNAAAVKILELWQRIAGATSPRAAIIRLATPVSGNRRRAASQVLTDFYDKHYSNIVQLLH